MQRCTWPRKFLANKQSRHPRIIRYYREQSGISLSNLKAVKEAAEEFLSKETKLHVLYNNGGIIPPPMDTLTADGYDLTFGINVLGHFYFTQLLLPILIATAKTSPDGKARIINTSSSSHLFLKMNLDPYKDSPARRKTSPKGLYAQSKSAIVVFATELARRYGEQGIVCTSLNPGYIKTPIQRSLKRNSWWVLTISADVESLSIWELEYDCV